MDFSIEPEQLWLVAKDGTRVAVDGHFKLEFTNGVDARAVVDVHI